MPPGTMRMSIDETEHRRHCWLPFTIKFAICSSIVETRLQWRNRFRLAVLRPAVEYVHLLCVIAPYFVDPSSKVSCLSLHRLDATLDFVHLVKQIVVLGPICVHLVQQRVQNVGLFQAQYADPPLTGRFDDDITTRHIRRLANTIGCTHTKKRGE